MRRSPEWLVPEAPDSWGTPRSPLCRGPSIAPGTQWAMRLIVDCRAGTAGTYPQADVRQVRLGSTSALVGLMGVRAPASCDLVAGPGLGGLAAAGLGAIADRIGAPDFPATAWCSDAV